MKNLLRCSDCFISLHRSEGFGLGLSEAMSLGKPTIATRYGGNVDFMNESNSCLVDYKLEPVGDNCYPHWQGQYWAEADVDQAFCYMLELLRDRHKRKRIGDNAKIQTRKQLSYASIGQLYENRIFEVMESKIH
jgi:glycosyltransferase involved in cell wall biosynthesis